MSELDKTISLLENFGADSLERENNSYYEGDQFRFWVGSSPSPNDPKSAEIMAEIKKVFVSSNFIRQCINRHVCALIGELPNFNVKDKNADKDAKDIVSAEKTLKDWIDSMMEIGATQGTTDKQNPFIKAVTSMAVTGTAYLRIFRRSRYENSPDINKRVSVHCPHNSHVRMEYDEEESLVAIEYLFGEKIERQELDPVTGVLHFYIYENDLAKQQGTVLEDYELDLNHNWSIFEFKAPSLIIPSVKQQQNAINLSLTMMSRNTVQAGFLERVLLNAQSPGTYEKDEHGEWFFVPDPNGYVTGPGAAPVVKGIPIGSDPTNPEGYTNPSVAFRDPVPVQTFIDSVTCLVERMYHEFGQGHMLASADGSVSGVSRIQLRQDFSNTLRLHKLAVKLNYANMLYVVLMLIGKYTNKVEEYRKYAVTATLKLSDHLLTPEEETGIREDFKAGLLSHETCLDKKNIEDPLGELERIERDKKAAIEAVQASIADTSGTQPAATKTQPSV